MRCKRGVIKVAFVLYMIATKNLSYIAQEVRLILEGDNQIKLIAESSLIGER